MNGYVGGFGEFATVRFAFWDEGGGWVGGGSVWCSLSSEFRRYYNITSRICVHRRIKQVISTPKDGIREGEPTFLLTMVLQEVNEAEERRK